jgi:hypothetical protein
MSALRSLMMRSRQTRRSHVERATRLVAWVSIDLVRHQAADLVVPEVEDIAEQRVDTAASFQRGLYGALGYDDVTFLDETSQLNVWKTGRSVVLDRVVEGDPSAELEVRGHLPSDVMSEAGEDHLVIPGPESFDVPLDNALLDGRG